MALIPDEAIWRAEEIPAGAFRMYAYFCLRRDHESGVCFPSLTRTADDMNMGYTYASTMRKALLDAGWIAIEDGRVRPLAGFDSSGNAETMFRKPETIIPQIRNNVPDMRKKSSANAEGGKGKKFRISGTKVPQKRNLSSAKPEVPYIEPGQLTNTTNQSTADKPPSRAAEIFDYWKTRLNHPTARFSPDRAKLIAARMKEGYTVEELKQAIDGCAASEWHKGKNDRNRAFDGLDLICRNGGNVDKFIALALDVPTNRNGAKPSYIIPPKPATDCLDCGGTDWMTIDGKNWPCSHSKLNGNGAHV